MRTLKITMSTKEGNTSTVSIANASPDTDLTVAKLGAFVDSYDTIMGGTIESLTKAIVTTSEDTIIYPSQN